MPPKTSSSGISDSSTPPVCESLSGSLASKSALNFLSGGSRYESWISNVSWTDSRGLGPAVEACLALRFSLAGLVGVGAYASEGYEQRAERGEYRYIRHEDRQPLLWGRLWKSQGRELSRGRKTGRPIQSPCLKSGVGGWTAGVYGQVR